MKVNLTVKELNTLKRGLDCLVILEQDKNNYSELYTKLIGD